MPIVGRMLLPDSRRDEGGLNLVHEVMAANLGLGVKRGDIFGHPPSAPDPICLVAIRRDRLPTN